MPRYVLFHNDDNFISQTEAIGWLLTTSNSAIEKRLQKYFFLYCQSTLMTHRETVTCLCTHVLTAYVTVFLNIHWP